MDRRAEPWAAPLAESFVYAHSTRLHQLQLCAAKGDWRHVEAELAQLGRTLVEAIGWLAGKEDEFDHQRQRIDTEANAVETRLTELASAGIVGSLDEIRDGRDQRPPLARRSVPRSVLRAVRVQPHPKGVATTLTSFKDECDTCLQRRRHREATLDQRVEIAWRA